MLISYAVVTPGPSGTLLGMTIQVTKPGIVPMLCGLVTAYFLVLYLLGVYADWTVRRVRRWTPYVVFDEIASKAALEIAKRRRVVDSHIKAGLGRTQQWRSLGEERDRKVQAFYARRDALAANIEDGSASDLEAVLREMKMISEQVMDVYDEYHFKMEEPISSDDMTLQPIPDTSDAETTQDEIDAAIKRERRITRVRLAVEVLAPSLLGLMAVIRTLFLK
jgi:hypothetical protein